MERKTLALSLCALLYWSYSANAASSPELQVLATPPNCPSDDGAVVTLPAGKGATIYGARARDEVTLVAIQYDRGQGWQWDGNPFKLWDPREPNNTPGVKPYPQQDAGIFDPIPNNGILKLKIYARGRFNYQDFCVNMVLHGQEANGTPNIGIVTLPGEPLNTLLWFVLK